MPTYLANLILGPDIDVVKDSYWHLIKQKILKMNISDFSSVYNFNKQYCGQNYRVAQELAPS